MYSSKIHFYASGLFAWWLEPVEWSHRHSVSSAFSLVCNKNISSTTGYSCDFGYLTPLNSTPTPLCFAFADLRLSFRLHGNYHIQTRAATYTYYSLVITKHANTAGAADVFPCTPVPVSRGETMLPYPPLHVKDTLLCCNRSIRVTFVVDLLPLYVSGFNICYSYLLFATTTYW